MKNTNTLTVICKDLAGIVPSAIQVIPFGYHETPKGVFELSPAEAPGIIMQFERQVNDMVIDYEHQTLAEPPVAAPAAGWIKKLTDKGKDGIWAAVEWTDRARQMIASKEYRYVSPVFIKRKSDNKVIALINVALTNQPNIDGMVPLVNKLSLATPGQAADSYQQSANKNKEEPIMKNVLKLLGLSGEATEEQAVIAVNKLLADAQAGQSAVLAQAGKDKTVIVANKAVLDALGLKEGATEPEITGTIMAMKQSHGSVAELVTQVNSLTARLADRDATEAVESSMKAGKVTPAQKDWATEYAKRDLAGFQVFVSKAPVVVFQGKVVGDDKPDEGALDAVQIEINKQCGVDTETFKKFGGDK